MYVNNSVYILFSLLPGIIDPIDRQQHSLPLPKKLTDKTVFTRSALTPRLRFVFANRYLTRSDPSKKWHFDISMMILVYIFLLIKKNNFNNID